MLSLPGPNEPWFPILGEHVTEAPGPSPSILNHKRSTCLHSFEELTDSMLMSWTFPANMDYNANMLHTRKSVLTMSAVIVDSCSIALWRNGTDHRSENLSHRIQFVLAFASPSYHDGRTTVLFLWSHLSATCYRVFHCSIID